MDKKKKIIIFIVSVIVLIIGIGVGLFLYFHSATTLINRMQDALEKEWYVEINENEEVPEFFSVIEQTSSFVVTDVEDDGKGYYTITVDVTSPDVCAALTEYQNSIAGVVTKEEMDKALTDIVHSAELKTTSQTAVYIKTDDMVDIQFSEDFVDAMYGYAYTYAMNQFNEATVY